MADHASGKHYRNGLSLGDVMRKFPEGATTAVWTVKQRWPDGVRCDSDNVRSHVKPPFMAYRCRPCRNFFPYRTGTIIHRSNVGTHVWGLATDLLSTGDQGKVRHEVAPGFGDRVKDGVALGSSHMGNLE